MSDFGIGSQSGDSGGGGFSDPSAGGGSGGQDNLGLGGDPSAFGDSGGGGWSPWGGGGSGFGGGWGGNPPPQAAVGSAADPATQSAAQGNQQQQQQQQQRQQMPSRTSQLEDLVKSMFGGAQHAMSPTMQSLAGAAHTGMGWFTGAGNPGDTTGLTTPPGGGSPNDPGNAIGGFPSGGTGSISQDTHDIMGDLRQMFGLGGGATPGAASTGNQATSGAGQPTPVQTQDISGGVPTAASADPTTGQSTFTPDPAVPLPTQDPRTAQRGDTGAAAAPAAAPAPDTSSAAPPSPQSGSNFGQQSGQPGPGDQVTGTEASQGAYSAPGQGGAPQFQPPNIGKIFSDLLRGDFGSLIGDLLGQQGMPANQNYANRARPPQYGQAPGRNFAPAPAPAALQAGPGNFGAATPGIAGLQSQGNLADGPSRGAATAPPTATSPQASASSAPPDATKPPAAATKPGQTTPVPQASDATRAALGLPPAGGAPSPATPAAAAPAATPGASQDTPRRVPTQRITGAQAVNLGNGQPANAPLTPQNYDAYLQQVGRIESGGNPNAVTGSNAGLYQFGPGEQRRYGITNWRDPAQQQRAMRMETNENTQILRRALGRDPTPGE
ncbi:MAG TPA: hypothetical protein VHT52_24095, partial [Stellaceae bacterium]|nr:hypothetical protein [Stellaceae bacterium]